MAGPAATATEFQRAQARTELHCRVLAVGGPASGKTSLVLGRLERLVSAGLPGESILSVSPTPELAAHQRAMLASRCGNRIVGTLLVSSLAEIAAAAVGRHWSRLGYPVEPALVTPAIRAALVRDLFRDGEDRGWGRAPEIARHPAFLRTVLRALDGDGPSACGLDEDRFSAFERRYRDALRQQAIFDRSAAFADATRVLIDGTEDASAIEHVLADDIDAHAADGREYLCALAASASSVVATASSDLPDAVDMTSLAATLDCEPLLLDPRVVATADPNGEDRTPPTVQWTRFATTIEELESMTEHMLVLRRGGVAWDDITVMALDDGAADRIVDACRRARIPAASNRPHEWVTHLDRLLEATIGDDGAAAAGALVAAAGTALVGPDAADVTRMLQRVLGADDPVGALESVARRERGGTRGLVSVIECFQRATKLTREDRDVATVAWTLWRGLPIATQLRKADARTEVHPLTVAGARSVAAWHRELRSAVSLEHDLTVADWYAARRLVSSLSNATRPNEGLTGSAVQVRAANETIAPIGPHLFIPLLRISDRQFTSDDLSRMQRSMAFASRMVRVSASGGPIGPPPFLANRSDLNVEHDEKAAESDITVLLRAVGSATTPLDDQIVIAGALAAVDVDVPWATGGAPEGPVSSILPSARPALNGRALSRLNRCGLRFWFNDIVGLGAAAATAEDRLAEEIRAVLREWSESGDAADEASLRSLLDARVAEAVRPSLQSPALIGPLRARLASIAAAVCREASLPLGEPISTAVGVTGELFGVEIDVVVDVLLGHPGGLELLLWQVDAGLVDRLAGEIDLNLAAIKLGELFPQHDVVAASVVDVTSGTTVPVSLGPDATKRILLEGATRLATGDLAPRRSAECMSCPYQMLCPAHPQGRASW